MTQKGQTRDLNTLTAQYLNIWKTAGDAIAKIANYWIVCCDAVGYLATAWLLVILCNATAFDSDLLLIKKLLLHVLT